MCSGVKSLVVDDEPMNHMVAKGIFKRYGMEVFTANSGKEAIAMCETGDYDIIFMDHMMPEMDGIEATKQIRTVLTRRHKEIPVVALTANAVSTAKKMFLREGFDGFISKPIELSELERVLRKVLPKELCTEVFESEEEVHGRTAEKPAAVPAAPALETGADKPLSFLEQVAALGIDTQLALCYCQKDEDFYKQILLQYIESGPGKRLDADKFCGDRDFSNYAIVVHALKSTSKMIGANKLSDMAKALEDAAKAGDDEFIQAHHEMVMAEYKRLVEGIARVYKETAEVSEDTDAGVMEFSADDTVTEFAPEESGEDAGSDDDDILEFMPEED